MVKPVDMDELLKAKLSGLDVISNEGLGSMPINRDIDYFGFSKVTTTDKFMELVTKRSYDDGIEYLNKAIQKGEKVGPPTLFVDWLKDEKLWMVTGHEGRGRAMAIFDLYISGFLADDKISVHIIPTGLRSRDMDEEKLNAEFVCERFFRKFEYPEHKKYLDVYIHKL